MGFVVALVTGLHVLCCGLLLPLLAGVSLATILPSRPPIGAITALLGMVGFVWYVRKSRATCPARTNRRCWSGLRMRDEPRRVSYLRVP